jgi:hypothetical protein
MMVRYDYNATGKPIIAAKLRLSTNFAIMVSFDVKEASVSATLARPEIGLGTRVQRLGKAETVEPRYVFGAVARATVTVNSEPRGAIQATSLRGRSKPSPEPLK